MALRHALALIAACSALLLSTGCGVIYATQNYGSPLNGHTVSQGASRADVLASMGNPNSIYSSSDTETFVYKGMTGWNFLGLVSKLQRKDTVVVMDEKGIVLTVVPIEVGGGWRIISPPFLDASHPVPSSELMFNPENYKRQANFELK